MLCDDKVRVEGAKSAKRLCSLKHRATSRAESDCAIFIRFRWLDPGEADSEDAGRSKINRDDTNPGVRESGSSRTRERRPLQPGRRSERFTGKIRRPGRKPGQLPRAESRRGSGVAQESSAESIPILAKIWLLSGTANENSCKASRRRGPCFTHVTGCTTEMPACFLTRSGRCDDPPTRSSLRLLGLPRADKTRGACR